MNELDNNVADIIRALGAQSAIIISIRIDHTVNIIIDIKVLMVICSRYIPNI